MMAHVPACIAIVTVLIGGLSSGLVGSARAEQPSIEQLAATAKSADETARLTAIADLGKRGAPAVPVLVELMKSDSPVVRAYAARSLGTVGAPAKSAAESLVSLLADTDPAVRRQAPAALAAIRPGPKVTVPLFAKLMQDSDPGVRLRVMEAVAEAKGAAVPALTEALSDKATDYWACVILRDIGPDAAAAAPALVKKLSDPRPEVRREATLALASLGSVEAVPSIAPLLKDTKDETLRTAATYALGALGRIPADVASIVRANTQSKDHLLATTSIWALARVNPKDMTLKREAVTALVARLKDEDPFVRTAAARALAALPPSPEISIPIFEKALASADATTVQYMLDALAGMGPQAVPRLINALDHKPLRKQVAYVLGQMGPQAAPAADALTKLVNDSDLDVAIESTHALAKIGPAAKVAVPELIVAVKETEGTHAHAAAFALGMIGPGAAAAEPALTDLINGKDDSLSLISAWALLKIKGPSAATAAKVLPELVIGLESPQPKTRQAAAEAIGSLGPLAKSAAASLQTATKDENEGVRAAATQALKAIEG